MVYEWEQATTSFISKWPRSGLFFDFMHFMSYPGILGWILWTVVLLLQRKFLSSKIFWNAAIVSVLLGDLVSRRILKFFFQRPRPLFSQSVCADSSCWGFVSSHSTNITAFVTVLSLYDPRNLIWGLPLVSLVSFSRLYLLEHYPSDVIGGIILGFLVGHLTYFVSKKIKDAYESKKQKGELNDEYRYHENLHAAVSKSKKF